MMQQFATLRLRERPGRDGGQVHCGTVWGTHFHCGVKFVHYNSPAMHFDNRLDPVSHAASKWRIVSDTGDGALTD